MRHATANALKDQTKSTCILNPFFFQVDLPSCQASRDSVSYQNSNDRMRPLETRHLVVLTIHYNTNMHTPSESATVVLFAKIKAKQKRDNYVALKGKKRT